MADMKGQLEFDVEAGGASAKINALKRDLASLGQVAKEAGEASARGMKEAEAAGDTAGAKLDAATSNLISRIKRSMAELSNGMKGSLDAGLAERLASARGLNLTALQPYIDALRQVEAGAYSAARAEQALEASAKQLVAAERELSSLRTTEQQRAAQDFLSGQRTAQAQATQRLIEAERELTAARDAAARAGRGQDQGEQQATAAALAAAQQRARAATAELAAIQQGTSSGSAAIKSRDDFINALQREANAAGKTRTELLALQAAEMGVSAQAAPLLQRLKEAESGLNRTGISAAQTAAALRMVPAQMTDIVTSLASGMPPLMVLVQQGGQLKDAFGGVGPAARALGGYIAGLVSPTTLLAAAVVALGAAYLKGNSESAAFARAITLTGNAAGITEGQFNALAKTVSESTDTTIGSARQALLALVNTGQLSGDALSKAATATQLLGKVTGESAEAIAKRFAAATESPSKFAAELNKQYNFLSAAQQRQIKELEDQGRTQEALSKTFDALNERLGKAAQNMSYVERAWNALKVVASKPIDFVVNFGRNGTLEDALGDAQRRLDELRGPTPFKNATLVESARAAVGGDAYLQQQIQAQQALVDRLRESAKLGQDVAKAGADRIQAENRVTAAVEEQNKYKTKQQQLDKAIFDYAAKIGAALNDPLVSQSDKDGLLKNYQKNIDEIRDKYKEPKGPSTTGAFNDKNRAEVEAVKQAEKEKLEVIKRAQEDVSLQRATGQISEREAIEESTRLDLRALETRRDALRQEAALVSKKKDATGEAAALTRQAAEIEDQITTRSIKGKNEIIKLDHQRAEAIRSVIAAQYEQDQNDRIKANTDDSDARREYFNQQLVEKKSLEDENRVLDLQASLLFSTAEARQVASERLKIQIALEKQLQDIRSRFGPESAQEKQAIENADVQMQQVQRRVFISEWEKTTDQVGQALTDALINGGKSGAEYIKGLFRAMVLKPVIQAIVQPVAGAVASLFSPAASGSGPGGLGGLLSSAGNAASIFNAGSSLGGLGAFGSAFSAGSAMTMTGFGGTAAALEGGAAMIGSATGFSSAMAGIGQIVGALGPYAAAAALVLSMVDFGGGTPHRGGAFTVSSDFLAGGTLANAANTPGFGLESGAFRSDRSADVDKSVQTLVTGVASTIGSALTSFGLGSARVTGKFASDNDDNSWGGLRIVGSNGRVLANLDSRNFNSDPQKGFEEFSNQAGKTVRDALIAADLPAWADDILKSVSDSAGIDAINQVVSEIKAISDASKSLAPALNITTDQFIALTRAVGGASSTATLVSGYIQAIYTDSEQLAVRQKVLAQAFRDINVAVPTSAAAYRKLVESQNLNTEAGRKMYLSLLQLAPVFGEIADAADELKNQAKGVIDEIARLRSTTDKDSATTQAQFAIKTAAARAGDKDALSELPGLSKAVEDALTATAHSAAEVAGIRASLAASLTDTLKALKVPGFATGGDHAGGWRVVGEAGPELEYTPPARIFSNSQTQALMDNSEVVAELRALREKLLDLEEKAAANAMHSARTAKLLERAMPDGDAIAIRAAT